MMNEFANEAENLKSQQLVAVRELKAKNNKSLAEK